MNAINTSGLQPQPPYKSWIDYWEGRSGNKLDRTGTYRCPAECGRACSVTDFDGCHVQKVSDTSQKMYIVPLCSACNHRDDAFYVYENLLVPAP